MTDRSGAGRSVMDVRTAWTFDLYQIRSFAETLFEADYLDTARDVLDFMAKPWKWQPEKDLYVAMGEPLPNSSQDTQRWAMFVEALEGLS